MKLQLKVCGLREPDNIEAILQRVQPDYLGFIFYERSARYVGGKLPPFFARQLDTVRKVGVFVDEKTARIADVAGDYGLDVVQLHGNESPEACAALQAQGLTVVKVFSVGADFDFGRMAAYTPHVDAFLFDTPGKHPGGNGYPFDWDLLQQYASERPFWLSGGIGPESLPHLQAFSHVRWQVIDVNSRFELNPGQKNVEMLESFVRAWK
ncbi:MAG: phosphoribosylanthranilate isomerase [Bacteroidia bacterium]